MQLTPGPLMQLSLVLRGSSLPGITTLLTTGGQVPTGISLARAPFSEAHLPFLVPVVLDFFPSQKQPETRTCVQGAYVETEGGKEKPPTVLLSKFGCVQVGPKPAQGLTRPRGMCPRIAHH